MGLGLIFLFLEDFFSYNFSRIAGGFGFDSRYVVVLEDRVYFEISGGRCVVIGVLIF